MMEKIKKFNGFNKKPSIIICGMPGSGKGTQSKLISDDLGLIHISTGDIIRSSGNKRLMDAAASGTFISDEDTLELIKGFLDKKKDAKGFIWDGYPRTPTQTIAFKKLVDEFGIEISAVIVLKPDKETTTKRLIARANKEGRKDDTEEKIKLRMEDFKKKTEPCIDKLSTYVKKSNWLVVKGDPGIDNVNKMIKNFLAEII